LQGRKDEDALRNDMFKELKGNADFSFPEGSDDNNCGQYREMELKSHFVKFGEKFNEKVLIHDKEPGLLVTTKSMSCVFYESSQRDTLKSSLT
jgi:hypothetical protein